MPTLDERVAYLEGRLEEHSGNVDALQGGVQETRRQIDSLDQKMDRGFRDLDVKIDGLGIRLDSRIDALDAKMSRQFTWLVGIQILMFIAIMSALANR